MSNIHEDAITAIAEQAKNIAAAVRSAQDAIDRGWETTGNRTYIDKASKRVLRLQESARVLAYAAGVQPPNLTVLLQRHGRRDQDKTQPSAGSEQS